MPWPTIPLTDSTLGNILNQTVGFLRISSSFLHTGDTCSPGAALGVQETSGQNPGNSAYTWHRRRNDASFRRPYCSGRIATVNTPLFPLPSAGLTLLTRPTIVLTSRSIEERQRRPWLGNDCTTIYDEPYTRTHPCYTFTKTTQPGTYRGTPSVPSSSSPTVSLPRPQNQSRCQLVKTILLFFLSSDHVTA